VSQKLLLADDSLTIQRVIELTFSGEEIQVIAVSDGEQAISRIPAERPDIVLADIAMPKRSGYEVAAFIKGHPEFKHIPVLLLAGAFEPVDEAKAEQVGCDGVLVKPFEPQQVVARVRELLDGAKGSPTQPATATVPRPVERLTPPRTSEPVSRSAEAAAQSAQAAAQSPKPAGDQSMDDYFDKLDAAFAKMGSAKASPATSSAAPANSDQGVPTLDRVLAQPAAPPVDLPVATPPVPLTPLPLRIATPPVEPAETPPTLAPGAAPPHSANVGSGSPTPNVGSASPTPTLASGFSRKEDRTIIADAFSALIALEQGDPGAKPVRLTTQAAQPVITDALVEEVARRVLERLAPGVARDVVVEVVAEIAERLVREEIARIRSQQS
jgi:CheY-like chemotaxis protein